MSHERLAIVDPVSGKQPLYSNDKKLVLAANGEIYNHREIRGKYDGIYDFQTQSDCEVILALYKDKGLDFVDDLNGIFGFAIYDADEDFILLLGITWELFHCILVGMKMERFMWLQNLKRSRDFVPK